MKADGFTLIEMLIVLVIAAILLSIAIPSYRNYVIQSNLSEAFNNLSSYQVQMEQYFQDNGNYGTNACGATLPTTTHFTYTCQLVNSGQSYTATAAGNGVGGITGYTFTINDSNNQITTAFPGATVPAACWLTKAAGC